MSWTAYRLLLEAMCDHGIEWVKGTTSQPPVMRVARAMGRRVYATNHRRGASFPPGWFQPALDDA